MQRVIVRKPKRGVIREHFQKKVSAGIIDPAEFSTAAFMNELRHFRCVVDGRHRHIRADDVRRFFSDTGIDRKNVTPADLERAEPLLRGGRVSRSGKRRGKDMRVLDYTGDRKKQLQKAAREYGQRKREKALYELGVFKPRVMNTSAFNVCRKSGSENVRPPDIKRASKILSLLNETESKAMPVEELKKKIAGNPLFPKGGSIKRPILHLRYLGIIDTSIHGWAIVSKKFATVDRQHLELKFELLNARNELEYMGRIIRGRHGGILPRTTHPDWRDLKIAESTVKGIEKKLAETKLGKMILKNGLEFPQTIFRGDVS